MANVAGRVLSVNVGGVREFEYNGRPARSAIWKSPVEGRVAVGGVNLDGDTQADRKAHGGPDKAVYAYAIEDLRWWEAQLGRPLEFGIFGENLTTEGIDVNDARRRAVEGRDHAPRSVRAAHSMLALRRAYGRQIFSAALYRRIASRGILANSRRG